MRLLAMACQSAWAFALMRPRTGRNPKPWFLRSALIRSMRLAQSIDRLARFARHAFPPRLETDGLLLSLADTPRERGRLDVVPFAGRGRIDAHRTRRMSGERNDVFARGVACVDEQSVGGLAVAKRMKRALRLARRSSRLLLPGLV